MRTHHLIPLNWIATSILLAAALTLVTPVPGAQAVAEGDVAPDFQLQDLLTGTGFSLNEFRGQVICINFWAYW